MAKMSLSLAPEIAARRVYSVKGRAKASDSSRSGYRPDGKSRYAQESCVNFLELNENGRSRSLPQNLPCSLRLTSARRSRD